MKTLFDDINPVEFLVLSGILGSLLYTAHIYRIRTKERATTLQVQAQKTDDKSSNSFKPTEKPQRDEMDREPGGALSFIYLSSSRA